MKSPFKTITLVVVSTLLLMWPMALNRGTVLYPDSFTYVGHNFSGALKIVDKLTGGTKVEVPAVPAGARGDAAPPPKKKHSDPIGGRSLYYGLFAWSSWTIGGMAAISLAQAMWAAIVLASMLPRFGIVRFGQQLAIVAGLSALTSIAFFADTALPDLFAGIGVAALAMLLGFGERMRTGERLWWMANLAFAALSHNAILATLAGALVIAAVLTWRRAGSGRWWAAVALGAAFVGTVAIGPIVERVSGGKVVPVPFLLARAIGDGTAGKVLAADCPTVAYATCRYLPYLPLSEEDFLWNRTTTEPWVALPVETRRAINAESRTILVETLTRYPVEQLVASTGNFARQLVTHDLGKFGRADILDAMERLARNNRFGADIDAYRDSLIWQQRFPLGPLSALWLVVHLAAVAVVITLLVRGRRQGEDIDPAVSVFVVTVLVGLVANAAVHGMLSLVVGRYQSRLGWLALFSAIVLAWPMIARRRVAAPTGPG